jgi:hypothetical protein
VDHSVRVPGFEEPIAALLELPANAPDHLAKADGLLNRFAGQHLSTRAVHHGRRNVVGGDDGVERRGGTVHHEGFVEAGVPNRAAAFAHVDE